MSKPRHWAVLWVALSLSIGWGICGIYGHEDGAMFPGMVASRAAVYDNPWVSHASKHFRFGPDATTTKEKPEAGAPHP